MMRQQTADGACKLVIHKSDFLILAVACCTLAVGIVRWQANTRNVSAVTIPASSTSSFSRSNAPTINAPTTMADLVEAKLPDAVESVDTQATAVAPQTDDVESAPAAQYLEYTVVSGDSLSEIAVQYNTDVRTLTQLNGLSGTTIRVGQRLRYPNPELN